MGTRSAFLALFLACAGCAPVRPEASWDEGRLITALASPDADARRRAAALLGRQDGGAALWPLVRALGDPAWEVRAAAVGSLGKLGDGRADRALLAAARDGHWWVRTAALKALAHRRPAGSEDAASRALMSDNESVREAGRRLLEGV